MCTILNKIKQNKNNQQRELKINFPITRTVIVYEMEMKNKFCVVQSPATYKIKLRYLSIIDSITE